MLPVFALVFDSLDGYAARHNPSRQSRLGADRDFSLFPSLAVRNPLASDS